MRYMNTYDIESASARYNNHPVLGPAVRTLANLVDWTNRNSDGWSYWPKPARAADKLMALIEGDDHPEGTRGARFDDERADATPDKLKAALRPVKAFRTRTTSPLKPGETAAFEIVETLADIERLDERENETRRLSHIALAQAVADEYGVTVTPNKQGA